MILFCYLMTASHNKTAKDKQKRNLTQIFIKERNNKQEKSDILQVGLVAAVALRLPFSDAELLTAPQYEVRAVAALVYQPIRERSAMQAHIEHRHPTDVSSCSFEKALFLSMARQAFVLLWKSS